MARLIDRVLPRPAAEDRSSSAVTIVGPNTSEKILESYADFVEDGYQSNAPIWSLIQVRAQALSEVEFWWQDIRTKELVEPVEELREPWVGGSAGDLETVVEVDVSLAGNAYMRLDPATKKFTRLHPMSVDVVVRADRNRTNVELLGYDYYPEGDRNGKRVRLTADEVAHIAPMPDPTAHFRGQSWISAVAREADGDILMTKHKNKFFTNGATSTLAVTAESSLTEDQRTTLRKQFQAKQAGWQNAYKTIFLEGGADVKVIGANMEQVTFSQVQGRGETRLAAAANVPPIVAGFSEGLQAGTYSNYGQAVRKFVDFFCRPRWRQDCEAYTSVLTPPREGLRVWYDDRAVSFMQQDAADAAAIRKEDALTIESLIRSGYTPESAVEAVTTGRFDGIKHTGLVSVQLQPPGVSVDSQDSGIVPPTDDGEPDND